jgi:hypothetical protein
MEYEISEITNGQYSVSINLESCLAAHELSAINSNLLDIEKHDEHFHDLGNQPLALIKGGILTYRSETVLPKIQNPKKNRVLMVFGNPATHSIKHGMFFFSDGRMWRHKMWRKLHDARLIELISYSKEKMVMFDQRKKEAEERKRLIISGVTSDKDIVGLTTFYSFPTPVINKYKFSNVDGVRRIFRQIICDIDRMEIKRISDYEFSQNASLVFVKKGTCEIFKSCKDRNQIGRCIYWPGVRGRYSTGSCLRSMLDTHENCGESPHNKSLNADSKAAG